MVSRFIFQHGTPDQIVGYVASLLLLTVFEIAAMYHFVGDKSDTFWLWLYMEISWSAATRIKEFFAEQALTN